MSKQDTSTATAVREADEFIETHRARLKPYGWGIVDKDGNFAGAWPEKKVTEGNASFLSKYCDNMNTSDLTGAQLDYWVAKALGLQDARISGGVCRYTVIGTSVLYSPSTDWSQGGPLVQDNDIVVQREGRIWVAKKMNPSLSFSVCYASGNSYLMAAMRCYIASKYGDEVPDES